MAKVKYDVSNVEDMGDFKQAPKGTYRAKIHETTVGESKAGQPMLTIVFELTKDSKGKKLKEKYGRIWHRVPLEHWEDTAGWTFRLKEFIRALGLKEKGSFDPEKLEGKEVQLNVRAGKDQDDEYRAEVGKLMPLPSDDADDDDDEDVDEDVEDEDEDEDEDESDEDDEDDEDSEDEDDEDEEDEDDDEDEEDEDEEDDESEDYSDWSLNQLKKEARSRGIKVSKKHEEDDLRELLIESDAEEAEDEDEDADEDDESVDYSEWEVDDLKKELKERGLKTNGSKNQMIARLEKDDESGEDPF